VGTIKKGNSTMGLYSQVTRSAEAGLEDLYLEVPITNTSGAVGTAVRQKGFGLVGTTTTPISRTSAGLYVLNLDQRWQALVEIDISFCDGAVAPTTDGITLTAVTRALNIAQPTVTFQLVRADGTAADPFKGGGTGSMVVHLTLKSTTV